MALTTTSAVKAYKALTSTDLDALIASLVLRASAAIETHLSRKIESGAVIEYRDGNNGVTLPLREFPVSAVSAVYIDGQLIPSGGFTQAGWRLSGRMLVLNGFRFTVGSGNVQVNYTAGYAVVPPDIEQAAIETVLLMIERRSHIDVSSKSLAGETISFITAEITPSSQRLLAPHRRVAP